MSTTGSAGALLSVDHQGNLQPGEPPQGLCQVEEPLSPQPAGPHRGHRARGGHHPGARRPDGSRDEERRRPQGQAEGERKARGEPRTQARESESRRHPGEGGDRERGVPDGEAADETQAEGGPARDGSRVAWKGGQGGEEGEAGDQGHEEVGRRSRGGHQGHVGGSPGCEERADPARPRAAEAAREQPDEGDEERRARQPVQAVGGVRGQGGQQGRQQVGVERPVVGLVPQGRRELAPEHVATHQEEHGVVVRDRLVKGRPVERAPRHQEGGRERDGGKRAARGRAHGRKCTLDKHGPLGVV